MDFRHLGLAVFGTDVTFTERTELRPEMGPGQVITRPVSRALPASMPGDHSAALGCRWAPPRHRRSRPANPQRPPQAGTGSMRQLLVQCCQWQAAAPVSRAPSPWAINRPGREAGRKSNLNLKLPQAQPKLDPERSGTAATGTLPVPDAARSGFLHGTVTVLLDQLLESRGCLQESEPPRTHMRPKQGQCRAPAAYTPR